MKLLVVQVEAIQGNFTMNTSVVDSDIANNTEFGCRIKLTQLKC